MVWLGLSFIQAPSFAYAQLIRLRLDGTLGGLDLLTNASLSAPPLVMTSSLPPPHSTRDASESDPLAFLISRGASLFQVQQALSSGANPNLASPEEASPLFAAVRLLRDDLISPLANAGARMDERDEQGLAALHIAARYGHLPTVKALLSHGANPNALSDDSFPIHLAARSRNPSETLRALFDAGADPNAQDGNRRSYLHCALFAGFFQTDEIPLPPGFNPDLLDDKGRRPLTLALEIRDANLANALLRLGADPEALSPDGFSPLFLARRSGLASCEGLIIALLDARELRAALPASGSTPAHASPRGFHL